MILTDMKMTIKYFDEEQKKNTILNKLDWPRQSKRERMKKFCI